jgi:hypothetical protein
MNDSHPPRASSRGPANRREVPRDSARRCLTAQALVAERAIFDSAVDSLLAQLISLDAYERAWRRPI